MYRKSKTAILSWCLYDWANSAYPSVIMTFVFATYFTKAVAPTPEKGTALWGDAMAVSGLAVAIIAPVIGAIADKGGRRKPWLGFFTVLMAASSAALWYVTPDESAVMLALVLVAIGNMAFEFGMVFYNAMLPEVAPRDRLGTISGIGWGFGYLGGIICLGAALYGFIQTDTPLFGFSTDEAQNVRAVTLLIGAWTAVFALPLFLFVPDGTGKRLPMTKACREGIATLIETFRHLGRYRLVARYLLAHMIYTDGLNTLFAFGGIFAAGTFGMPLDEVILFGIALNITAGAGAIVFGFIDDRIGPKRVILISLAALVMLGTAALLVEDKAVFWAIGLAIGIFIGPAQASSRSMMAHLCPRHLETEFFGLYALSGRVTSFMGPLLLAIMTDALNSQRAGMAVVVFFLFAGAALLIPIHAHVVEHD